MYHTSTTRILSDVGPVRDGELIWSRRQILSECKEPQNVISDPVRLRRDSEDDQLYSQSIRCRQSRIATMLQLRLTFLRIIFFVQLGLKHPRSSIHADTTDVFEGGRSVIPPYVDGFAQTSQHSVGFLVIGFDLVVPTLRYKAVSV